jgi:hypothetical protein
MKIGSVQNRQPAFNGLEKLAVGSLFVKNGALKGVLSDYARMYHKNFLACAYNDLQIGMQDEMIRYSKKTGLVPQWYIENLKYKGIQVPEDFMSGNEDVMIATGGKDIDKLTKFVKKRFAWQKIDIIRARLQYLFSSKYKGMPKDNRYYSSMMEVLNKYRGRTDKFLAENNAENITLEQIIARIANAN